MATPAQVRNEIKRRELPYDVFKTKSCWYVVGDNASSWHSSSLHTYTFANKPAAYWVDIIAEMQTDYLRREGLLDNDS